MKSLVIAGDRYTYQQDNTWLGKDPNLQRWLNEGSEDLRQDLSSADGDPRTSIFHQLADRFNATSLVDDEAISSEARIY